MRRTTSPLSLLLLLSASLLSALAHADIPLCPPEPGETQASVPFALEALDIRYPETTVFVAPPPNVCVSPRSLPNTTLFTFGIVTDGLTTMELDPVLPPGTAIRLTIRHTRGDNFAYGHISIKGADGSLYKHEDNNGARERLTVLAKTGHFRPITFGSPCSQNDPFTSFAELSVVLNRIRGEYYEYSTPGFSITDGPPTGFQVEFPRDDPSDVAGYFTARVILRACPREDSPFDAKHETFYSIGDIKEIFKHSNSILAITPEMARFLIKPILMKEERGQMKIIGFNWRWSYGEKTSLDGLPTSDKPTGVVLSILAKALTENFR